MHPSTNQRGGPREMCGPVVHLRLAGAVLTADRAGFGGDVGALCRRSVRRHPAVVHLDLSRVTDLSTATIHTLDRGFERLRTAGWRVIVTPPDAATSRADFLAAAIRHEFGWARGSETTTHRLAVSH